MISFRNAGIFNYMSLFLSKAFHSNKGWHTKKMLCSIIVLVYLYDFILISFKCGSVHNEQKRSAEPWSWMDRHYKIGQDDRFDEGGSTFFSGGIFIGYARKSDCLI